MNTKRFIIILIVLILIFVSVSTVFAKTQPPGLYHKIKPNGDCMQKYFKNGGPNENSGWIPGGCSVNSDDENPENSGDNLRINSLGLSQVVKVLTANYNNGVLNLTWLGIPNSARICKDQLGNNCLKDLEPPVKLGVNTKGYFGYMLIKLNEGTYFVDFQGSKNGGAVKFEVK